MGEVRERITLKNALDEGDVQRGRIQEHEVRQATVPVLVDTGTSNVILTEATCERLGLAVKERQVVSLAGGVKHEGMRVGPIEVHWKDRYTICFPVVLPGEKEDLLGVIPLDDMDLIVDPVNGRLAGAHGDLWAKYVKRVAPHPASAGRPWEEPAAARGAGAPPERAGWRTASSPQ